MVGTLMRLAFRSFSFSEYMHLLGTSLSLVDRVVA